MMRGGARPGAGRKKMPIKRQSHSFRLFDDEYFYFKDAKKQFDLGLHLELISIIRLAILKKLKKKKYRLSQLMLMKRVNH